MIVRREKGEQNARYISRLNIGHESGTNGDEEKEGETTGEASKRAGEKKKKKKENRERNDRSGRGGLRRFSTCPVT